MKNFTTLLFLLSTSISFGQHNHVHAIDQCNEAISEDYINPLISRINGTTPPSDFSKKDRAQFKELQERLVEKLRDEVSNYTFLCSDSLGSLVSRLKDRIFSYNKDVLTEPIDLIISADPTVNANSTGYRTIVLHASLVLTMQTHEELMFVIAHELAHEYLNHRRNSIDFYISNVDEKMDLKAIKRKAREENFSYEELIEYFKETSKLLYAYSKSQEYEADSLAMVFIQNAQCPADLGLSALKSFESLEKSKLVLDWKEILSFSDFPFNSSWLKHPRGLTFTDGISSQELELMSTHPNTMERIEFLTANFENDSTSQPTNIDIDDITEKAIYDQIIFHLYKKMDLARALQIAYSAKKKKRLSAFGQLQIAKIWKELYKLRVNRTFSEVVPTPPAKIKYEIDQLLLILNNMRLLDLAEIGFRASLQTEPAIEELTEIHEYFKNELKE